MSKMMETIESRFIVGLVIGFVLALPIVLFLKVSHDREVELREKLDRMEESIKVMEERVSLETDPEEKQSLLEALSNYKKDILVYQVLLGKSDCYEEALSRCEYFIREYEIMLHETKPDTPKFVIDSMESEIKRFEAYHTKIKKLSQK